MKEAYATAENIDLKAERWLEELKSYSKAGRFPFSPLASALLVIDLQKFFLDESSHAFIPTSKAIIPNIQKLLNIYRKYNYPIIFTQHSLKNQEDPGVMGRWWGDVIKEGEGSSLVLKPFEHEPVIRKNRYSAFHDTELERLLSGAKSVVITGVATHLCCETTAREAFMKDFLVYFVIDATATLNEELHLAALKTLAHGFAIPVLTEDILRGF